jgi:carboxylesterase
MSEFLKNPQLDGDAFYWEAGKTGVLLCHGFTATTAEVRLLAMILYENNYTVSAPLLPGHYATPDDLNQTRWQDWLGAVETSYNKLAERCEYVVVGGESTGAVLTLHLAALHPEIKAVLAYAPALITTSPVLRLISKIIYLFLPVIPKKESGRSHADDYWQGYMVNPVKAARQLFKLQSQTRQKLNQIRQPVLVIQGRHDTTVDPKVPGLIAGSVQSNLIEIHWLESSTHCVMIDCEYEQAARITLDFLQKIDNLMK